MGSSDDELEDLRKRAYGRQADIHLDPDALERLRELEGEHSAKQAVERPEFDDLTEAVHSPEPGVDEGATDGVDVPSAPDRRPRPTARAVLVSGIRRLSKLRRSTVVIALAVVAFAVAVVVVLTLVQRVQTDPLQAGASQVARLQADPGYRIPDSFDAFGLGAVEPRAFHDFHGLRVILFAVQQGSSNVGNKCMNVYPESEITDPSSSSFQGTIFGGCSAGGFPAITQFEAQDLPLAARKAIAPWASLQFVYEKKDDEVVVFGKK
jgi:hypothetical protein